MALNQTQVKDVIATALFKAGEDENFKEKLLVSPIKTIEKLTGERLTFNNGIKTATIEPTAQDGFDLVIPSYVDSYNQELSEEELALVAGGGQAHYNSKEEFVSFLESYL